MHSSDAANRKSTWEELLAQLPSHWKSALLDEPTDLAGDLAKICFLQSPLANPNAADVQAYRRDGFSTYWLRARGENGTIDIGYVQFAPLFGGDYLIRKTLLATKQVVTVAEHYDEDGRYLGRFTDMSPNLLWVGSTDMEPRCVVVSHLYNILLHEYQQAGMGQAKSKRILTVERLLRGVDRDHELSYRVRPDEAVERMNRKIRENELDPVLTFADKQAVRQNLQRERATITQVKHRVHGVSRFRAWLDGFREDVRARSIGIVKLPGEKVRGTLYKYTIGNLIWFFGVIRGNIGYSIALAIYGPFTFFFITQPMNPSAMWAVGKIRNAYIQTTDVIHSIPFIGGGAKENSPEMKDASAESADGEKKLRYDFTTRYAGVKPGFEGMPTALDVPDVEKQSWSDRMSNMKAMEIAYEENLQFSQRIGRLEQMEQQLNYAIIAETAYRELEIYQERLNGLSARIAARKISDPAALAYVEQEKSRARQFKLYVWDKFVRYMLDHAYIVLNEANDQVYVDYYVGRNFIFLEEITKDLMKQYQGLRKPEGFKRIEELAKMYSEKKVDAPTLEERLEKNSLLYKMKDFYNTGELRNHVKRQWEILYLSQNRAQEAANFGLQTYTWSTRNAVWALSALTTAKSREIELITNALGAEDQARFAKLLAEDKAKVEPLIESLFHILTLEYVSIREELDHGLDADIDSTQRQIIIEGLKRSFKERTAFLKALSPNLKH